MVHNATPLRKTTRGHRTITEYYQPTNHTILVTRFNDRHLIEALRLDPNTTPSDYLDIVDPQSYFGPITPRRPESPLQRLTPTD